MYTCHCMLEISQISTGTQTRASMRLKTDTLSQTLIGSDTLSDIYIPLLLKLFQKSLLTSVRYAWRKSQGMYYCDTMYIKVFKVIVPTIVVYFFLNVTTQEIHTNKYKTTFHSQQIDQYIHSCDIFTKN